MGDIDRFSAAQRYSYTEISGEINYFVKMLNSLLGELDKKFDKSFKFQIFNVGRVRDILERSPLYESEFMKNLKK